MKQDYSIIKRNVPKEIKDKGTISVRVDLIDPITSLYTTMYYKDILEDIHQIGRNYAQIDTLIEYYKESFSETTLRRLLKEMEKFKLITIVTDKQRSYVMLQNTALIYLNGKINNWKPRAPGEIQLDKSKCLFRAAKQNGASVLFVKNNQRYMKLTQLMYHMKQDLDLGSVDLFDIERLETEHCYLNYAIYEEPAWGLSFMILDLGKLSRFALLFRVIKIIEEIRRCLYSSYSRSDQSKFINEDLYIHIEIITHSEYKNGILNAYLQNAITGNITADDKEKIEDEIGTEFDLNDIKDSLVFTYDLIA
jgi:hypothetical protein